MITDIIQSLKSEIKTDISNISPDSSSDVTGIPDYIIISDSSGSWLDNEVYTNTLLDGKKIYRKSFVLSPATLIAEYEHQTNIDKILNISMNFVDEGSYYTTYSMNLFGAISVRIKVDSTKITLTTSDVVDVVFGYIDYTKNEDS